MKRLFLLLSLTLSIIICYGKIALQKNADEVVIRNDYISLHLSKDRGWLPDKLEYSGIGTILSDFHIYTDWGIYERGYVGSKEEKEGRISIDEKQGEVTVTAEGELKSKDKRMEEKIGYIVKFVVSNEPRLKVEVELKPQMKPRKVSAFLAHLFQVHSAKQWMVNGLDGIISEDMNGEVGRMWESRNEPLSIDDPFIIVITNWGQIHIDGISSEPQAQNIFLFNGSGGNLVLFFGFLDGGLQEISTPFRASYNIEFNPITR